MLGLNPLLDESDGRPLVFAKGYACLWILSRTPQLLEPVVKQLVEQAKGFGFNTDELEFVNQQ